jgi:hypothetical protein
MPLAAGLELVLYLYRDRGLFYPDTPLIEAG